MRMRSIHRSERAFAVESKLGRLDICQVSNKARLALGLHKC
jgi:hypothetical protein